MPSHSSQSDIHIPPTFHVISQRRPHFSLSGSCAALSRLKPFHVDSH